jgi:hypothetical protein
VANFQHVILQVVSPDEPKVSRLSEELRCAKGDRLLYEGALSTERWSAKIHVTITPRPRPSRVGAMTVCELTLSPHQVDLSYYLLPAL